MIKEKVNICCATDDNFAQHCAVMICSLLENTKTPEEIFFYMLLTSDLKEENKRIFEDLIKKYNSHINFVFVPSKFFEKLPTNNSFTKNAFSRVFIPDVLPNIEKIIYLDCDIVVKGDIKKLWSMEMNNKTISAVQNYSLKNIYENVLNFTQDYYFNSGVLVIDLIRFEKNKIKEKVIDFATKNSTKLIHPDQQSLYYALYNDWNELPLAWNFIYLTPKSKTLSNYSPQIYNAIKNPKIIHFVGGNKPTNPENSGLFKQIYFYYLAMTPFKRNMTDYEQKKYLTRLGYQQRLLS